MKKRKGCTNIECKEYRKTYFKEEQMFCSGCGKPLVPVCQSHGCFKPIPADKKSVFCAIHEAEAKDKKDKTIKTATAVGAGALGLLGAAIGIIVGIKKKD